MTRRSTFRLQALALLGFLLACAAVFALMWRFAGGDVDPFDEPYRVQAVVPTAVALAVHADVRQAGVKIGEVTKIAERGDNAVLLLQLDRDHAPAYRDARVLVRAKTLSGENYVALDPGTPAAGRVPSGGTLTLEHAGQAVQLDEILSSLDRKRRRSLQRLLDGLGGGLRGRGEDLNRFLEATSAVIRQSTPVNEQLAADRRQVASLVDDVGRVSRAIGDRGDAVVVLTRRARQLAQAIAGRDERLRATLAELPGFLRQARTTTTGLGRFADQATPVIGDLADASDRLVPAVRRLRPAATATRRATDALAAFSAKATPLVTELRPFATAATAAAEPLEAVLRELNPLQDYLAPYARDLGGVIAANRAGSEIYDALGHYSRVVPLVSKSSVFGVLTPELEAAYQALVKAGGLSVIDQRGHNAYPKPGTAGAPVPFSGAYPRLQREPPYRR
ncbi:Long-chain-fatty-acid--CoA ligase [Patulibacter medicamentivorans]|uniref:Long-chain-fatty-acid--CoA ligase n=1 Tax=Patulibacter medicamentivorans TaxID=1097667 RepID=H0E6M4_9ACTN|nr:MlaD family protein [Patulibacter medicamentivorans]EHN10671.1 Long-chain-fatty-acid--CoA ligase [Patulibacter medicamentivorans]